MTSKTTHLRSPLRWRCTLLLRLHFDLLPRRLEPRASVTRRRGDPTAGRNRDRRRLRFECHYMHRFGHRIPCFGHCSPHSVHCTPHSGHCTPRSGHCMLQSGHLHSIVHFDPDNHRFDQHIRHFVGCIRHFVGRNLHSDLHSIAVMNN